MSTHAPIRRITAPQITARKGGEPIVSLTSYHAHTAAIVDRYADFILVGDSLGMVMHGMESTVPVPLDLMIMHGRAVVRGTKQALIVVDMPFGTYEESPQIAFRNAARIMKGVVRKISFLEQMIISVLSGHRTIGPPGLLGGGSGKVGSTSLVRHDGSVEVLKYADQIEGKKGDILVVKTPVGGGLGKSPQ